MAFRIINTTVEPSAVIGVAETPIWSADRIVEYPLPSSAVIPQNQETLEFNAALGMWEYVTGGAAASGAFVNSGTTTIANSAAPDYNAGANDFLFGSQAVATDTERIFFDKANAAFRVGSTSAGQWGTIGAGSVGMGVDCTASAAGSFALGNGSTAGFANSFVWSDGTPRTATAVNQVLFGAANGFDIIGPTLITGTLGAGVATLGSGSTFGTLTIGSGNISDSLGLISFADDNLLTTGTIGAGAGSTFGTMTIGSGSIVDSSGSISFSNENLLTLGTLGAGVATLGSGSTFGTLTVGSGSITDSSGAISFGNENLVTTGTLGAGIATLSSGTQVGNISLADGALDAGFANISTTGSCSSVNNLCVNLDASTSVHAGTLQMTSGQIIDTSGAITFGNENLVTTGTLGAGVATLGSGSTFGTMTVGSGSLTDSSGAITFGNENLKTSGNIAVEDKFEAQQVGVGSAFMTGESRIYRTFSTTLGSGIIFGNDEMLPLDQDGVLSDGVMNIGSVAQRFATVYATTGTINTSDNEQKEQLATMSDTELAVAEALSTCFLTYKFKSSVALKGEAARTHTGIIAQTIGAAFSDHGLDACAYGMYCVDTVYEVDGKSMDDNAIPYTAESEGVTERLAYGVRYDELLCFVVAANAQKMTDLKSRVEDLESTVSDMLK